VIIALLAATIAALALALLSLLHTFGYPVPWRPDPDRFASATWSTGVGEHRRQVLPDGSVITLGARSSVSIKFTAFERDVTLASGEALFQVAHNKARPFKVFAGNGSVTAVGTEFNVLRQARRVVVTVTEGTVLVAPLSPPIRDLHTKDALFADTPLWIPARIARGQEMSYDAEGQASAVAQTDSHIVTAWSHGTLVYRRRQLAEVIEDVKRYSPREISLGEGVGQLLYTGTVAELNVNDWIHALPKIYPVEVIEDNSSPVRIRIQLRAESARSHQENENQ
jgi:transmembrane sensor